MIAVFKTIYYYQVSDWHPFCWTHSNSVSMWMIDTECLISPLIIWTRHHLIMYGSCFRLYPMWRQYIYYYRDAVGHYFCWTHSNSAPMLMIDTECLISPQTYWTQLHSITYDSCFRHYPMWRQYIYYHQVADWHPFYWTRSNSVPMGMVDIEWLISPR